MGRSSSYCSTTRSDDNKNVIAALDHVVFAELEPAVADAFAGLEIVLVAVPGAGEVHIIGELLPLIGAVGVQNVYHLVDQDAFARRPASVHAVVGIGVVGTVLEEY